ncbi:MAG: agmatine deiminase family protein [Pseudomonadota bacterium]
MAKPADASTTYLAPAEEAPHARTWMCWPSTKSIYGWGTYFEQVQETLARLAAAIAENEPVFMLADAQHHELAARLCGPRVKLVDVPVHDMWARDTGPVFVKTPDGGNAAVDFNFNGWGGKQWPGKDADVPDAIAAYLDVPRIEAGIVGEGGGLEYDGEGTLLLTDSCWVNDNRNPGMSQAEIEAELKRVLGAEKVIWLPGVRGQDITDGHIDGSVRFIRPGLVMTGGYPGDTSDWGRTLKESRAILSRERDARGRSIEMVDIPSAVDVRSSRPDFFTGYANFYIGNGAVYTPQFGDKSADRRAQEALAKLFPDRRIVALDVDRIYENGGGIHCVTQQEPA